MLFRLQDFYFKFWLGLKEITLQNKNKIKLRKSKSLLDESLGIKLFYKLNLKNKCLRLDHLGAQYPRKLVYCQFTIYCCGLVYILPFGKNLVGITWFELLKKKMDLWNGYSLVNFLFPL